MAKSTVIIDDIDGAIAAKTITFSWNCSEYEIDLSSDNIERFRAQLAPWIASARKTGTRKPASRRAAAAGSDDSAAIRDWGRRNGFEVSDRGRIPAIVHAAYRAAQQEQVPQRRLVSASS